MAYTTIDDSEAYFQVVTYAGDGSANHAITLPGDTDMQPDLVWIKNRDQTDSPCLFDAVRGATKVIKSDSGDAEATDADTLDSFTSDGFQVDADVKVNTNTENYVAWCWKESATAGFDIVAADGTGSARTQAHSLSAVAEWIFVKEISTDGSWYTYTAMMGNTKAMFLNATNAVSGDSSGYWNDTTPTSSVFSLGTDGGVNQSSTGYIFYLWRSVQGFSKFGKFVGNGHATNGPFVYTGFQPAFVMVKRAIGGTGNWMLVDNKRPGYNQEDNYKYDFKINNNDAERSSVTSADFFSNGFKVRTDSTDWNVSGDTYIYMAFARAPFVNSNGVPCNAK